MRYGDTAASLVTWSRTLRILIISKSKIGCERTLFWVNRRRPEVCNACLKWHPTKCVPGMLQTVAAPLEKLCAGTRDVLCVLYCPTSCISTSVGCYSLSVAVKVTALPLPTADVCRAARQYDWWTAVSFPRATHSRTAKSWKLLCCVIYIYIYIYIYISDLFFF